MACFLFNVSQSCYRYPAGLDHDNIQIADWLIKLSNNNKTCGCRLCFLYLGHVKSYLWNEEHCSARPAYRIYKELKPNRRIKPNKRIHPTQPETLTVPIAKNESWPIEFMHDQPSDGRKYRIDNLIDDYNRES